MSLFEMANMRVLWVNKLLWPERRTPLATGFPASCGVLFPLKCLRQDFTSCSVSPKDKNLFPFRHSRWRDSAARHIRRCPSTSAGCTGAAGERASGAPPISVPARPTFALQGRVKRIATSNRLRASRVWSRMAQTADTESPREPKCRCCRLGHCKIVNREGEGCGAGL